jgi:hypothetical protein
MRKRHPKWKLKIKLPTWTSDFDFEKKLLQRKIMDYATLISFAFEFIIIKYHQIGIQILLSSKIEVISRI